MTDLSPEAKELQVRLAARAFEDALRDLRKLTGRSSGEVLTLASDEVLDDKAGLDILLTWCNIRGM